MAGEGTSMPQGVTRPSGTMSQMMSGGASLANLARSKFQNAPKSSSAAEGNKSILQGLSRIENVLMRMLKANIAATKGSSGGVLGFGGMKKSQSLTREAVMKYSPETVFLWDKLTEIGKKLGGKSGGAEPWWKKLLGLLGAGAMALWGFLKKILAPFSAIFGMLRKFGSMFGRVVRSIGSTIWKGVKWVGSHIWKGVKWVGSHIWSGLKWVGKGFGKLMSSLWSKLPSFITGPLTKLGHLLMSGLKGLFAMLGAAGNSLLDLIPGRKKRRLAKAKVRPRNARGQFVKPRSPAQIAAQKKATKAAAEAAAKRRAAKTTTNMVAKKATEKTATSLAKKGLARVIPGIGTALSVVDMVGDYKDAKKQWGNDSSNVAAQTIAGERKKNPTVMGMAGNVLKYGAVGAAIGSAIPLLGTAVGGIIGGVVGAAVELIGQENIAKAGRFISGASAKDYEKEIDYWQKLQNDEEEMKRLGYSREDVANKLKEYTNKYMEQVRQGGFTGAFGGLFDNAVDQKAMSVEAFTDLLKKSDEEIMKLTGKTRAEVQAEAQAQMADLEADIRKDMEDELKNLSPERQKALIASRTAEGTLKYRAKAAEEKYDALDDEEDDLDDATTDSSKTDAERAQARAKLAQVRDQRKNLKLQQIQAEFDRGTQEAETEMIADGKTEEEIRKFRAERAKEFLVKKRELEREWDEARLKTNVATLEASADALDDEEENLEDLIDDSSKSALERQQAREKLKLVRLKMAEKAREIATAKMQKEVAEFDADTAEEIRDMEADGKSAEDIRRYRIQREAERRMMIANSQREAIDNQISTLDKDLKDGKISQAQHDAELARLRGERDKVTQAQRLAEQEQVVRETITKIEGMRKQAAMFKQMGGFMAQLGESIDKSADALANGMNAKADASINSKTGSPQQNSALGGMDPQLAKLWKNSLKETPGLMRQQTQATKEGAAASASTATTLTKTGIKTSTTISGTVGVEEQKKNDVAAALANGQGISTDLTATGMAQQLRFIKVQAAVNKIMASENPTISSNLMNALSQYVVTGSTSFTAGSNTDVRDRTVAAAVTGDVIGAFTSGWRRVGQSQDFRIQDGSMRFGPPPPRSGGRKSIIIDEGSGNAPTRVSAAPDDEGFFTRNPILKRFFKMSMEAGYPVVAPDMLAQSSSAPAGIFQKNTANDETLKTLKGILLILKEMLGVNKEMKDKKITVSVPPQDMFDIQSAINRLSTQVI